MTEQAHPPGAKKRDYWFTVLLTDPVSLRIVRFLTKRRWLTPDQVTVIALVFGLAAGGFFALGERWGLIAGGSSFYLAFVFDCVDGKLARSTGVTSARGEALDHLADGGRRAAAGLGLAIHVWRAEDLADGDVWWVVVYAFLAYFFLEIAGAEKGEGGGRMAQAFAKRRLLPNPGMPDVQAIVYIFGPISGFVIPAFGVGIAMVTAAILKTIWRRLR